MADREYRSFAFDVSAVKDETNGTHLEGRPIVYDARTDLGYYDEIIDVGALDATDLRDVRFLINHNTNMIPLARSRNNNANSTMQMSVDAEGMAIRVNLDTENNSEARALYSSVERGDISGMSFMFTVDGETWEDLDTEHPTRRISSISKVFEVSAVTWPAYEQTSLEARSQALESAREAAQEALESAKAQEHLEELRKKIIEKVGEFHGNP